jgi:hypothetical protein
MKKEELLLVFDFLATALKSNIKDNDEESSDYMRKPKSNPEPEAKPVSLTPALDFSSSFGGSDIPSVGYITKTPIPQKFNINLADKTTTDHIKELMDKLDEKTKVESRTKQLLTDQKKDFETIIKSIKEEQTSMFLQEKTEDEAEPPQPTGRITNDDIIIPQVKFKDKFKNGITDMTDEDLMS